MNIFEKLNKKISKLILHRFYLSYIPQYALNREEVRGKKVIISLTSYPARFADLTICIKSLMNQTMKPDKIILYLGNDTDELDITEDILNLENFGLTIIKNIENIKPHKKYFFAMQEYPKDIIITVDDDVIYDRNLVKSLFNSYIENPTSISARRVHKIEFDKYGKMLPYNKWHQMCDHIVKPSKLLLATGVGGVLYPPNCLAKETFNLENIKQYCLNADDIWLKIMQLLNGTPVVWVKSKYKTPILLESAQKTALGVDNILNNQNDIYIKELMNIYHVSVDDFY